MVDGSLGVMFTRLHLFYNLTTQGRQRLPVLYAHREICKSSG